MADCRRVWFVRGVAILRSRSVSLGLLALFALVDARGEASANPSPFAYRPEMTGGPTIALPDKDLGITWQLHSGNWMENGPFFGVFSYEVGHQPHFTRQRFGWFGLGAEHFVSFLSSSTTATSIGVLGDYASVVNTIDRRTAYNTNAERLMAVVFFTTKSGFFVMASHGKEFEQGAAGTVNIARGGPLPDRVTWLGLGFTTP